MFQLLLLPILLFGITVTAKKSCKNKLYTTLEPILKALTMANAICPDDSTWFMADYYLDKPRCYGLYPVPQNLTQPIELLEVCTEKNANAMPVSIHNADEHNFIYNNTMDGGLIGFYLPSGKTYAVKNFKNMDGTAVDYAPVTTTSGDTTMNSFMSAKLTFSPTPFEKFITSRKANVVCAMWAVRAP